MTSTARPEESPAAQLFIWALPALLAASALSLLPAAQDNPAASAGRAALLAAVSFAALTLSRSVSGTLGLSILAAVTTAAVTIRLSDAPLVWALGGTLSVLLALTFRRINPGRPQLAGSALLTAGALLTAAALLTAGTLSSLPVSDPWNHAGISVGVALLFIGALLLGYPNRQAPAVTAARGVALCAGAALYAAMLGTAHVSGLLIGALVSAAAITVLVATPRMNRAHT